MRYSPLPYERLLTRYIAAHTKKIDKELDDTFDRVARTSSRVTLDEGEDFFFKDYPALSHAVDGMLRNLTRSVTASIVTGIQWSWNLAEMKNDDLVSRIVKSIGLSRIPEGAIDKWTNRTAEALDAFQDRKVGGLGLSERVWKYIGGTKGDLELALDLGLGEGKSADALSREVRRFLHEPDRLYRRVRDEKGVLRLSQSASNYHPGQGVYRSSYKNAQRLSATETNMAYRSADYERTQGLEFVLGIEVHLSNNHTCLNSKGEPVPFYDICDELQGIYPKDFKFTGWHPLCRCYTTTILPSNEEFMEYLASMDENGNTDYKFSGEVTELPDNFEKWMNENQNRIELAAQRGNLPYFITDNVDLIEQGVTLNPRDAYMPMSHKDLEYLANQGVIDKDSIFAYENYQSNMIRQATISRLVDGYAGFDIDTYAKIYGAKNPDVAELYKEIGILKEKDEVLRLRKINELKTICGALSAKEIEKWGLAKGLEYVGIDRNKVIIGAYFDYVNGKVIKGKELRKDLLMFRSPDSKVVYSYPLGMRRADAVYNIGEAAKFVKDMPDYLTKGVSSITFINTRNPLDKYWAAYYKWPKFESYATDGKDITFWRQTKENPAFFKYALTHEAGHIYDFAHNITKTTAWKQAIEADIALFNENKIASSFPTSYAKKAYMSSKDIREDFAESIAKKLEYDNKYGPKWFERLFPNRAKLLAEILAKWPNG